MKKIDPYSFECGVLSAWNSMLAQGRMPLVLLTQASKEKRDQLAAYAQQSCHSFGTGYYVDDTPLSTDFAPLPGTDCWGLVLYRTEDSLAQYLSLKAEALVFRQLPGGLTAEKRQSLAAKHGLLLGYNAQEVQLRLQNGQ